MGIFNQSRCHPLLAFWNGQMFAIQNIWRPRKFGSIHRQIQKYVVNHNKDGWSQNKINEDINIFICHFCHSTFFRLYLVYFPPYTVCFCTTVLVWQTSVHFKKLTAQEWMRGGFLGTWTLWGRSQVGRAATSTVLVSSTVVYCIIVAQLCHTVWHNS